MSKKFKKLTKSEMRKFSILSIVGILMIGLSWTLMSGNDDEGEDPSEGSGEELVIEDDRDKLVREKEKEKEVEVPEDAVDVNEESRETAKGNLEKADEPVEEEISEEEMEQLATDLAELFAFYGEEREDEGNFYASIEFSNSIAGRTPVSMSRQIDTALNLMGYEMDPSTAEWYQSKTDGVYQFLVSLKLDGYDDLVFSGNYNKNDRVFNVAKMDGILDLDDFAS